VENVDLDVRYPVQGGSTYANASRQTLARLIAESGMIDSYRLVHRDAETGYSRMAYTIHTRIDRIYTQAHNSVWRWQKVHSLPDIFTGNAASDHFPVIARLALAKERPPLPQRLKLTQPFSKTLTHASLPSFYGPSNSKSSPRKNTDMPRRGRPQR
jgi:hypothetical protein